MMPPWRVTEGGNKGWDIGGAAVRELGMLVEHVLHLPHVPPSAGGSRSSPAGVRARQRQGDD